MMRLYQCACVTRDSEPSGAEAVSLGAALLDQHQCDWRSMVRIDHLDVGREGWTVLGQLYGTHRAGLADLCLTHPDHYGFTAPHHVQWPATGPNLQSMWFDELIWPYLDLVRPKIKVGAEVLSMYFDGRDVQQMLQPLRMHLLWPDPLAALFGDYRIGRDCLRRVTDLSAEQMGFHSHIPNMMVAIQRGWLLYVRGEL